ncbi:MFS general substrate transporter [Dendrothele bispora CBS 962.96]|uniref:MFS general substrate transporter n=1 Tax=Dendrothele bispora (strain CBS 962.96) TaxID=1314807 RepID=A0A4S8L7T4_DENBC|nr:MFS general substrate transporter [Dendrothele bispora CBS 962.96]THU87000.1 MFS general substrate transporter [Dendrothele bispora CBS 962.96]
MTSTAPPGQTPVNERTSPSQAVGGPTPLEEYEASSSTRPPWLLTMTEVKLLGVAGVGFFLDAYDLFIINPVTTMLQYRLYGGNKLPPNLEGFVKAGANIGSVIGQFSFGYAADALGRKAVYGKELMLILLATVLTMTTPTGSLSPDNSLIYLGIFRILLGVGVGGDYPMSASVTSDRANLRKRGTLLAFIFSNQGWGSLIGSLVTIIVLLCYKHVMLDEGKVSKVDGVWRIIVGISLIPGFATLYQRLTMPESQRYKDAVQAEKNRDRDLEKEIRKLEKNQNVETQAMGAHAQPESEDSSSTDSPIGEEKRGEKETAAASADVPEEEQAPEVIATKKDKAHIGEFLAYFSEWRHAKILIGTSVCWFLLDIAFYGINLNQNVVLQQIHFDGSNETEPWTKLFRVSTGGIIITALGFVPGYYASIFFIEILGRKWIQIQGFLLAALFLGILAGRFTELGTVGFIVCFALLQFFFNFGANTTTYCYPAEVFPTRFRAFAHGISAAAGKAGAIISALAFNELSSSVGTPVVLWIFFGVCILGALFTLLLPEVKGRDPDLVYAQEIREDRIRRREMEGK